MPFTIHWVDQCTGAEVIENLQLPVGTLVITRQDSVITDIEWGQQNQPELMEVSQSELESSCQPLHPWLDPKATITLTLLKQGSSFRNQVWAELCKIPYGTTLTYAALANNLGTAARAVGNACRDNPYPLVIPCHRVVSKSGMGGYCGEITGEFMAIKERLLMFEKTYQ